MAPRKLGPYELLESLGRGGQGEVYRALHVELGVERALKVLNRPQDPSHQQRFQRELEALARVRHENVVRIHEAGSDEPAFFAMELLDGPRLDTVLREGRLPLARALAISVGLCRGVAALHAEGVLHRDIKPGNVVLVDGERPVLIDLGLAVAPERDDRLTKSGAAVGTFGYMAPEQLGGADDVSTATDLYALGLVVFELVSGERAIEVGGGLNMAEAVARTARASVRPLGEADPSLPALLERTLGLVLRRRPADRVRSAEELARTLERIAREPGPSIKSARGARLWTGLLAAAAVVVVVGGLALAPATRSAASPPPTVASGQIESAPAVVATPVATAAASAQPTPRGGPQVRLRVEGGRARLLASGHVLASNGRHAWLYRESGEVEEFWLTRTPEDVLAVTPDRFTYAIPSGESVLVRTLSGEELAFPRPPRLSALALSGGTPTLLAMNRHDNDVVIMELPSGRRLRVLGPHGDEILGVAFATRDLVVSASGDSHMFSQDQAVRVWDLRREAPLLARIGQPGKAGLILPLGEALIVGNSFRQLLRYGLRDGGLQHLYRASARSVESAFGGQPAHGGSLREAAATPDGRYLFSLADRSGDATDLRVWETESGRELGSFLSTSVEFSSVDIAPDGLRLLLSGDDTIEIWSLESGPLIPGLITPREESAGGD